MTSTCNHDAKLEAVSEPRARILSLYSFPCNDANGSRVTSIYDRLPKFDRFGAFHTALRMLRRRSSHDVALITGDTCGMIFAFLQRLTPWAHINTIMVDCLWYRAKTPLRRLLKRWQMRFCLKAVDRCIVWAEREVSSYSQEFGINPSKIVFVPHHSTLHPHRYSVTARNEGYIFAGGNGDRDYETFVEAVREVDCPCLIACTDDQRFKNIVLPPHVRRVKPNPQEFRQLIASSRMVVLPMAGGLIHSGGQQTFLNAMRLGKPVIVTDVEGGKSYINHGITGMLTTPGDAAELRNAAKYLLENDLAAHEMGQRAMQAAKEFTVANCYDRICAIADQITAGHGQQSLSQS